MKKKVALSQKGNMEQCEQRIYFIERFTVNQGYISLKVEFFIQGYYLSKCFFFSGVSRDIISIYACRGYMAPEYIHHGEITFKSDIYSLGVIIREIVMGRHNDATTDLDVC